MEPASRIPAVWLALEPTGPQPQVLPAWLPPLLALALEPPERRTPVPAAAQVLEPPELRPSVSPAWLPPWLASEPALEPQPRVPPALAPPDLAPEPTEPRPLAQAWPPASAQASSSRQP
jgi:hypothetical protein